MVFKDRQATRAAPRSIEELTAEAGRVKAALEIKYPNADSIVLGRVAGKIVEAEELKRMGRMDDGRCSSIKDRAESAAVRSQAAGEGIGAQRALSRKHTLQGALRVMGGLDTKSSVDLAYEAMRLEGSGRFAEAVRAWDNAADEARMERLGDEIVHEYDRNALNARFRGVVIRTQ